MRILTMGINNINPNKFQTAGKCMLNKPFFGLWGSTLYKTADNKIFSSWLEFVEGNEFHIDKYSKGISYTLYKNAKIYTVDSYESYIKLLSRYPLIEYENTELEKCNVDWDAFKRDYDAFHLTEDAFYNLRMIMYEYAFINGKEIRIADMYAYDCETWIIFNLDVVNKGSIQNVSVKLFT